MKSHHSPSTYVGCSLVVLSVFLFTATATGQLSVSPSIVNFGSVQVGASVSQSVSLKNTGNENLTISQAKVSGTAFSLSGLSIPLTLAPEESVSFSATFAPEATGNFTGSISLGYSAEYSEGYGRHRGSSTTVALTGTGTTSGQLAVNPGTMNFGSVQVGSSVYSSGTLTNSGGSNLTISQATVTGAGFTLSGLTLPLTLGAEKNVSFSVTFAPQSVGSSSGNVVFSSNGADSTLNLPLSGTGVSQGTLIANPTSLAFGNVQVGNRYSLSEALTNTGGSSITISQANVTGAMFSISGLTLPLTLTPSQSVTFTATFEPNGAGAASGSLSVVSNASDSTLAIAMSGTGTAAGTLAVSPTSLSFGNVVVGTSSALNGSLTASGASVTVQPANLTNGEFVLSGISLPDTIPAGQSATFTVTFTPQSSGSTSASLSFPSNASNSPTVQSMTGTGTPQTQHTVDLTWNATTGAIGYNIYRGTDSGGPYAMINNSLDATPTYTDSTVVSGQTYYYVVTDVDSELVQSAYSSQVQAMIPNP